MTKHSLVINTIKGENRGSFAAVRTAKDGGRAVRTPNKERGKFAAG